MKKISVVVPSYNEEESLPIFYDAVTGVLSKMEQAEYELIFINDGSKDRSIQILRELAAKNNRVKYISFTRNFGKEAAMLAGLQRATGDYVVIMDADLQHPVDLLPSMFFELQKGEVECVCAKREDRKGDGRLRSALTKRFYKLINSMTEVEMIDGAGDYRMMTRKMVDTMLTFKERTRYSKGLFSFVGYETKMLPYKNVERKLGKTKWSIWSLSKYAINGIISFSTVPLVISSFCGILSCLIAFVLAITTAIKTLIFGNPTDGWTTLVCIILFVGGLQMFFLGIIGQYLAKVYLEAKERPPFIVGETNII
jgi:glycosyltransferase involved in cell wall biosynthesis